jgi:hypothetical protein
MQVMDDNYRLVFRGEVLDNQHPAVVKKRLISALKLSEQQAERLFCGSSVVVKHNADTKTAARYQGLFKQAGARLRVLPVEDADSASELPAADDAPEAQAREIDTGPLKLLPTQDQPPGSLPAPEISAPDFSLAKVGVNLIEPRPIAAFELEVDFELAEVGALIPTLAKEVVVTVNVDELEFSVAEVGADLADRSPEPQAVVPDISHLSVVD